MPDGQLPHDIVLALGGASGLAAIYTVVRIVSAALKAVQDRRVDDGKLVLMDADSRRAMAEATEAGVGTLGQLVLVLNQRVKDLEHRERNLRNNVLTMIGDISAVILDAPADIRTRIQAVIERFRGDADVS